MISAFFQGIGFGLVLSVMIGPVFFGLIQTSILKGFKQGIYYAVGVSFSDITYIVLTHLGVLVLLQNPVFSTTLNLTGGIIIFLFGFYYLTKKQKKSGPPSGITLSRSNSFLKGFLLNLLTPTVWLFWFGTVSIVSVNYKSDFLVTFSFFIAVIIALFATDILKCYIAHKIKTFLKAEYLNIINKTVGIIFILAGIFLLAKNI